MAYLHIDNLYKNQDILLFRECYALEKIHGTSAHVAWKDGQLRFFSGGGKQATFEALFDHEALAASFTELALDPVVVYGEAYGGKCQGMRDTYGDKLKFIVFDVKVGGCWLAVPDMDQVAIELGLDVVAWRLLATDLAAIGSERDYPSIQAIRNGILDERKREGIVLRPLIELTKNNGSRIIAKHKREDFAETKTPRPVDPEKLKVLAEAQAIADEWVTEMRLSHVLGSLGGDVQIERTGDVIKAMIADVEREAEGEIVESKAARKAIGKRTAQMFKARLKSALYTQGADRTVGTSQQLPTHSHGVNDA